MRHPVTIPTPDGPCPATLLRPEGDTPLPAVILYMDAFGIRPTLVDMSEHLASLGYVVLLPDLYFRHGPYAPMDPRDVVGKPNWRELLAPLRATTGNAQAAKDTEAFLAFLANRADVQGDKVGTTGYCMGGGIALTAAAMYPDRIAAAASFHGGQLATDAPDSPHLLAPKIKATVYVAGAERDANYPPEQAQRLERALSDVAVPHRCEIYEGALHGYAIKDHPVYNEAADARHWRELERLLAGAFGK